MQLETRRSYMRDLRRIRDQSLLDRIERKISELEEANTITEVSNVKRLASPSGNDYRIRIGDYRLGVTVEGDLAILVRFGHRSDLYQSFP